VNIHWQQIGKISRKYT